MKETGEDSQTVELAEVEVMSSRISWQRVSQIRLGWWMRPLILIISLLLLGLSFTLLILSWMLKFIHLMTGGWLKPLHRLKLRVQRLVRWSAVTWLTSLVAVISPSLGLSLLASYCLIHSYDFPDRWMRWLMRLDTRRSI